MSCSLSSSTLIQEAGFLVLVAHLPPPWVVHAAVFLLWCLCKFRGLCFSGMSLHANQSRRPAACFLSQSYTSAGFRGETGQKAEKQKEGGEAGRQRDTERRAFKNASCHSLPVGACESQCSTRSPTETVVCWQMPGTHVDSPIIYTPFWQLVLCNIRTCISILAPPCLLSFTGISQLNEFCMKKQSSPNGCVTDQTVTQSPELYG